MDVRVRRDRLLRLHAGRLGVGLEVLVPRRDALRGAADLVRGRARPVAARHRHDHRHAFADDIVEQQDTIWFIVPQFVGFCIFLVAGFAETARAPFDLPEADAEIVAGYNTEYGGMRFGAFFMAEYMHIIVFGGLCAALFLGGWHGPGPALPRPGLGGRQDDRDRDALHLGAATLPRLRYDQLMNFGWKVLLPLATLNALVTAIVVVAW